MRLTSRIKGILYGLRGLTMMIHFLPATFGKTSLDDPLHVRQKDGLLLILGPLRPSRSFPHTTPLFCLDGTVTNFPYSCHIYQDHNFEFTYDSATKSNNNLFSQKKFTNASF